MLGYICSRRRRGSPAIFAVRVCGRACAVVAVSLFALGSAVAGPTFDEPIGTMPVPASWNGNGKASFSCTSYLFYQDGYPGGRVQQNLAPGLTVSATSGQFAVDSNNNSYINYGLSSPDYKSFGPAKFAFSAYYSGQRSDFGDAVDEGLSNLVKATDTVGTCVCQVVTPDPKKEGSFIPLPGAFIKFFQSYSSAEYIDGRNYATGTVIKQRGRTTHLVFGSDPSGSQKTDCAFPSGRAKAQFTFTAHLDGYKDVANIDGGNSMLGRDWPGHGCTIILVPETSNASSSSSVSVGDPTGGTGSWDGTGTPPTPPGATTPPGGSTPPAGDPGDGSLASFFNGFWARLQQFFSDMFTLDQADVDELKKIKDEFGSYGPLGFPNSIIREFNNAFLDKKGADGSDPHYWDFPLTLNLGVSGQFGSVYPAGYDPDKAYRPPTPASVQVTSLFPDHLDLAPYADNILRGRFISLIAIWSVVAFSLVRRFWPDLHL